MNHREETYIGKNLEIVEDRLKGIEEKFVGGDYTSFSEIQEDMRETLAPLVNECKSCYPSGDFMLEDRVLESQESQGFQSTERYVDSFGFGSRENEEKFVKKYNEICELGTEYKEAAFVFGRILSFGQFKKANGVLEAAREKYKK